MKILSLFDGISCGKLAAERANLDIKQYEAYEIDKYALEISKKNHPSIIHHGDVRACKVTKDNVPDLILAGSPCQGFSKAGKQLNFNDPRSALFFEFLRVLNEARLIKPDVKFILENVRMKKEYQEIINNLIGVEPILINSRLMSAQNRERLYWTNIKGIEQPTDREIVLSEVIDSGDVDRDKSYCLDANYFKGTNAKQYLCKNRRQIVWVIPEATKKGYVEVSEGQFIDLTFIKSKTRRGRMMLTKSNCLTASTFNYCKVTKDWFRLLTPLECERLQTLPEGYTEGVSNTQRYKMIGNGWTVDVIAHILDGLHKREESR